MSGRTAVVPKEKFKAPTSGLEKVTFSRGTTGDVVRFKDTLDKLAQHVGMWHVYGSAKNAKAMKGMAEPVFVRTVSPPRKYYKFWMEHHISDQETMVETSNQFTDGKMNIKLVDDTEWKFDLDMFIVIQKKYEKYQEAWIKNRSRTYNLVL